MAMSNMIQRYIILSGTAIAAIFAVACVCAQDEKGNRSTASEPVFLSFAKFKIPFNIEKKRAELARVQLWVSTDQGTSWQMHGTARPSDQYFDFNAAAEGTYYFSVQTVDQSGGVYPSQSPPLKILVDTTKPDAAIRADINAEGQLVIDIRTYDEHLNLETAELKIRTDREPEWKSIAAGRFNIVNEIYQSQAVVDIGVCREVGIVFAVADKANNSGEAAFKLSMPRTAQGRQDMTLASTQQSGARQVPLTGAPTIPGAIEWRPAQTARPSGSVPKQPESAKVTNQPGRLTATDIARPPSYDGQAEELPPPSPVQEYDVRPDGSYSQTGVSVSNQASIDTSELQLENQTSQDPSGGAYFCKTSAFSLDYAVESLGGSTLSSVELWGTTDAGRTWQLWGEDPDRQSPFDVQVEDEGLFGFRMVIVGSNGVVSNRPQDGDSADVWIHIDTTQPTVKITRAVYGKGDEDGMLVIDYNCQDSNLVSKPITLAYSETVEGPWKRIASGQANTGLYLWKATPNLPQRIYLKLEAVDKAGNIGVHRLDLPINTRGLGPRGRIQGFRPIFNPSSQ